MVRLACVLYLQVGVASRAEAPHTLTQFPHPQLTAHFTAPSDAPKNGCNVDQVCKVCTRNGGDGVVRELCYLLFPTIQSLTNACHWGCMQAARECGLLICPCNNMCVNCATLCAPREPPWSVGYPDGCIARKQGLEGRGQSVGVDDRIHPYKSGEIAA